MHNNMEGEANKILRNSIHAFINGYHFFVPVASLLVLPFSAALLLSQSLIISSSYSSTLSFICSRFRSLFLAMSFPPSSHLFNIFSLMLSQTIFSSVLTLPFTLTFLLLAKASIIRIAHEFPHFKKPPPSFSSLLNLYPSLLSTHLFNSFLILSANAGIFALLFLFLNAADLIGLSPNLHHAISLFGGILYSMVLAYAVVICNLSITVSAMEKCGGCLSVLKACVLIRGQVATALSLALPINLGMAAVEALFQYRVMRTYNVSEKFSVAIVCEAFTIAHMHSMLIVVEIIASCLFYKSCRLGCKGNWEDDDSWCQELELEDKCEV